MVRKRSSFRFLFFCFAEVVTVVVSVGLSSLFVYKVKAGSEDPRRIKPISIEDTSAGILSVKAAIDISRGINVSVDSETVSGSVPKLLVNDMMVVSNSLSQVSGRVVDLSRRVSIPEHEDFKSYMSYKALTAWGQKDLQDVAYDGTYGIRMVDGRYCVAVGTGCDTVVGDYITLVLENGVSIPAIVGDIKADAHTDSSRLITKANGCCSEFIVNTSLVEDSVLRSGSISNCTENWKSPVVEIVIHGINYFDERS